MLDHPSVCLRVVSIHSNQIWFHSHALSVWKVGTDVETEVEPENAGVPRQLVVPNDLLQLIEGCLCAPLVPLGQSSTIDLSSSL